MKTMNFSEALQDHEDEAKALGTGLHDLSALVPYALLTNRLHFWGGAWHAGVAGARLNRVNPSTATVLADFAWGMYEDADLAVQATQGAFPSWSTTPRSCVPMHSS